MLGIGAKPAKYVPNGNHPRQADTQTITAGYPTQVMAVDLLGPLPESKNGNRYVLVVGDYVFLPLDGGSTCTQSGSFNSSQEISR